MPGEHLTESRLSDILTCSRGPIREALNLLEKDGFVVLLPNQGAMVSKISVQDVSDYYFLLEILEGKAVEFATPQLTSNDINRLVKINESLKELPRNNMGFIEKWVSGNIKFHALFRKKCGNEKMKLIVEEIRNRITRYRYTSVMTLTLNDYIKDHETILEAVLRKDALEARVAMERHISRTKKNLLDLIHHLSAV